MQPDPLKQKQSLYWNAAEFQCHMNTLGFNYLGHIIDVLKFDYVSGHVIVQDEPLIPPLHNGFFILSHDYFELSSEKKSLQSSMIQELYLGWCVLLTHPWFNNQSKHMQSHEHFWIE
jgi:hypothetical protein